MIEQIKDDNDRGYLVSNDNLRNLKEYTGIDRELHDNETDQVDLNLYNNIIGRWKKGKYLGLHWTKRGEVSPSYFAGAVWLDEEKTLPIVVAPKLDDVDYQMMLSQVLAAFPDDNKLYCFKFEDPMIETKGIKNISPLQVIIFLFELSKFCRHELKRSFLRVEENFQGKVKGKILVNRNTMLNTCRGRPDRVYCQYQTFSIDNLDNQILKRALWVSQKVLSQVMSVNDNVWNWVKQCETDLAGVSLKTITFRDFSSRIYAGFHKRYKRIHKLAQMIILNFKVDPEGRVEPEETSFFTAPFYLDMNMLFEKYVGVMLKRGGLEVFRVEKKIPVSNNREIELKIKPDWLARHNDKGVVVDAKYKVLFEQGSIEKETEKDEAIDIKYNDELTIKVINSDMYQLISYMLLLNKNDKHILSGTLKDVAFLAFPVSGQNTIKVDINKEITGETDNLPYFKIPLVIDEKKKDIIVKCLPCYLPIKKS